MPTWTDRGDGPHRWPAPVNPAHLSRLRHHRGLNMTARQQVQVEKAGAICADLCDPVSPQATQSRPLSAVALSFADKADCPLVKLEYLFLILYFNHGQA
jgi:hypothetical protein